MTPVLVLWAVLAAVPTAPPSPAPLPIRRFAVLAGVNDGGPERVPLRYARSDAERMARVLERLGGVAPADTILLLEPDGAAFRAALRDVEARVAAARATSRAELVLYYSGHSDEQGLLLRGTHVPFPEVRRWLGSVPAQVRIAIVDSCSSGALTRQKGGLRAAPFLVDTSSAVKGHAILTSSAADEASQESDRIGASFFTYFLLSGLRGAADTTGDGKVTLTEAYQFAFAETLARTERTRSGAQHPTYDIQLAGSGDVVLTDLRGTDATLLFPEASTGRYFVRDDDGRLVAELRKPEGRPIALGLEAGTYRLVRDDGVRLGETRLAVARGGRTVVPVDGLTPVRREMTASRGGEIVAVPVDVSIWPPLSLNGERPTRNAVQLGLLAARTTRLHGAGLAGLALWAEEDVIGVQLGGLAASAGGAVEGAQLGGLGGFAGSVIGVQLGGLGAMARGHVEGAQVTGLGGTVGSLRGVQLGGLGVIAGGRVDGAQVSGIGGVAGSLRGVQLGGIGGYTRELRGLQLSGIGNVVEGDARGVQLSGIANVARRDLAGLQLGTVNVAGGVRGWQVGLVNVARQVDGIPLGLVNVVRDGWHRALVAVDEDGTPTVGWAGGNAWFHTTLEGSVRRTAGGERAWAAFGPGVHLAAERLGLDLDLLARRVVDDPGPWVVVTARALVALPLSRRVAVVAGPTVNALLARHADSAPPTGGAFGRTRLGGDGARAWLGLQAGVRL